jgi:hypothetical protein
VVPGWNRHLTRLRLFAHKAGAAGAAPKFKIGSGAEADGNGYLQAYVGIPMRLHAARFRGASGNVSEIIFKNAAGLGAADTDFAYGTSTAGDLPYVMKTIYSLLVSTVYDAQHELPLSEGPITLTSGLLVWITPYLTTGSSFFSDANFHRAVKTSEAPLGYFEGEIWYEPL